MADSTRKDIVDLQDIEKIQFLQTLQADPARFSAYVNDKKSRIIAETVDTKRASFVKLSGDMSRTMDMDHNSLAALDRTNDLASTQDQIIANQSKLFNSRQFNEDLTRRQVEINNWYYEEKRETLFLLQFVLLIVLTLVIVLGLSSRGYGFISDEASNYLMVFIVAVGAITWFGRWYYTRWVRDPAFWNKRKFAEDRASKPTDVCVGVGVGA
jgi:hypothetical protein